MSSPHFIDALFERTPTAPVTSVLVAACSLVFLAMLFAGGNPLHFPAPTLSEWGANRGPLTLGGQPWRLLSALFIHGGLLHLLLNMLALWQAGQLVERLFGSTAFAAVFFVSGLLASLASLWWQPAGLSVGASGAIFGVFGALLARLNLFRRELPVAGLRRLFASTLFFVAFSLVAGFLLPGIDNAAHLGGLLAGTLLGAGLARPLHGTPRRERAAAAAIVLVLAGGALWLTAKPPATPARVDPRATLLQELAEADHALVQRQAVLLAQMRSGSVSLGAALGTIEGELLPGWSRLGDRLALVEQGDRRVAELRRYLQARHDMLQALSLAIRTRSREWFEIAEQRHREAETLLLQLRMRQAVERSRAPLPEGAADERGSAQP